MAKDNQQTTRWTLVKVFPIFSHKDRFAQSRKEVGDFPQIHHIVFDFCWSVSQSSLVVCPYKFVTWVDFEFGVPDFVHVVLLYQGLLRLGSVL